MLDTFVALAEPNRLRIIDVLRGGPRCVNEIGDQLRLNQPQVSKHLRVLKHAGLVDVQARAQQRVYTIRAESLRQLYEWLEQYRQLWEARFDELEGLIDELHTKEKANARRKRK
jgi:DNA-binding transcriptional ArsR family regulator